MILYQFLGVKSSACLQLLSDFFLFSYYNALQWLSVCKIVKLYQQAEEGFDKLFGYERQQLESFDYQNMMKNGNIIDQLKLQKQELQSSERKTKINQDNNQENLLFISLENKETNNQIVYRRNRSDRL